MDTNRVRALEAIESSLSHGRVVILSGTNLMDHPFITSHDAFQWVVGVAKRLPIDQSIRLIAKGETLDVDKSFESTGDLIAFVASWRDKISSLRVVLPVSTNSTNRATITSSGADTAYVDAEIRRLRMKNKPSERLVVGQPARSSGLPPLSRATGLTTSFQPPQMVLNDSDQVFRSLQPPAFVRPPEKKTGLGRWWQRINSGPSYHVVSYTPGTVSWRHRQAYPYPMYAGGGVFQPTPVMIGSSW
jgi:hypothetical protein